jgi:hypothetical protein
MADFIAQHGQKMYQVLVFVVVCHGYISLANRGRVHLGVKHLTPNPSL